MSDTARDYRTTGTATTEGLEDLFEVENHVEVIDSQLVLTVAEASIHLRIPVSTLYRRIRAGKFKTQTAQDGAVRIILPIENQVITTLPSGENQNPEVILTDYHADNRSSRPTDLDRVLELLAEKDRKLEAATYRVGFLESQIAERQREIADQASAIKLLTDSQHEPGWWSRFASWFIGR